MKLFNTRSTFTVIGLSVLFFSCQETSSSNATSEAQAPITTETTPVTTPAASNKQYAVGDRVPNNQVCMVNNAYMGKDQFVVPFENKTYYGCCDMCVERIPKDASVRVAKDPLTAVEVDKANAFIVLAHADGAVAYFESEENYKKFMANNAL